MRKLVLISLVVVAVGLRAQEAHVIALKSEDAAHAKCTWERLQAAQKEWEEVQETINRDYLLVPQGDKDAGSQALWSYGNGEMALSAITSSCHVLSSSPKTKEQIDACEEEERKAEKEHKPYLFKRRGFDSGFQFSEDFKYIVPKTIGSGNLLLSPGWGGQCYIMDSNGGHYGSCGTLVN